MNAYGDPSLPRNRNERMIGFDYIADGFELFE